MQTHFAKEKIGKRNPRRSKDNRPKMVEKHNIQPLNCCVRRRKTESGNRVSICADQCIAVYNIALGKKSLEACSDVFGGREGDRRDGERIGYGERWLGTNAEADAMEEKWCIRV